MTPVALAQLTAALQATGLLRGTQGDLPRTITSLTDDSRNVRAGSVFVAVRGTTHDGHDYLDRAKAGGAAAAILDDPARTDLPALVVRDTRRAAAIAGAAFYNDPARSFTLVGVTGTNGKTTTVGILRHLLDDQRRAASIGTLGVLLGSEGRPFEGGGGLTTPGPIEFHRVLRALADGGIREVALEASSHALAQHRLDGAAFAAAVFTNFTRDHLDYHATMDEYFRAKTALVALLSVNGAAVVNADDGAWRALPKAPHTVTFGLGEHADVRAMDIRYDAAGSMFTLRAAGAAHPVELPLVGDFNVANALGAATAAIAVGRDPAAVAARLASTPQVVGRLERLSTSPSVYRDYAHTPDALERALTAMRPFTPGRLIVVFGCGGDRDPGKRPEMGGVAERLADHVIVTSDNPRTEDPERILDDIEAGMSRRDHERVEDRRDAIARAIARADAERDVVLLAGKGHETYQIRGTERLPFDEAVVVRDLLAGR